MKIKYTSVMEVKTSDTTLSISNQTVKFPAQCSSYKIGPHDTLSFIRNTQERESIKDHALRFDSDCSDKVPCIYDTEARKITAGAQGKEITAGLYYNVSGSNTNDAVRFSLQLPNFKMKPSDEDYVTFTHNLTNNNVVVCFKSTRDEIKMQDIIGFPKINFALNHDFEFSFGEYNLTIYDKTAGCQLYPKVEGCQVDLVGVPFENSDLSSFGN